jgi:SAM-dependent methyltransferase
MNPRYYIKHMENIGLIKEKADFAVDRALDLGCGRGGDSAYLASLGYDVTSVDKESFYPPAIISDVRTFFIEPLKYSLIICNNVLPFLPSKKDAEDVIARIAAGLSSGGSAFITLYGLHSGFKERKDMIFYSYVEALSVIQSLPFDIMDQTMSEGYAKNSRDEIIYQHSFRFILRKR